MTPQAESPIFISYPKSGRSWVRYFLHLRDCNMPFSHVETGTRRREVGRTVKNFDMSLATGRPIIFMHRNPIDTAVSFYFQVHKKDFRRDSWRFVERFPKFWLQGRLPPRDLATFLRHPGYGVEKVCGFNRTWLDHLKSYPRVLTLSYEDARAQDTQTFLSILEFIGADTTGYEEAVEKSRFENMREAEQKGTAQFDWLRIGTKGDPDSAKVRRGKIGGYTDYLRQEEVEEFRQTARNYGFDA